jgi:hypothetical protein
MDQAPLLFETQIVGQLGDIQPRRYSDYDDALAGHAELVGRVKCMLR